MQKKTKVCMIVQNKMVKGGIAAVVSGYYGSKMEQDNDLIYFESDKVIQGYLRIFPLC